MGEGGSINVPQKIRRTEVSFWPFWAVFLDKLGPEAWVESSLIWPDLNDLHIVQKTVDFGSLSEGRKRNRHKQTHNTT